jgi:hypothetical protein
MLRLLRRCLPILVASIMVPHLVAAATGDGMGLEPEPHRRRGDMIATGMTVLPWPQQVVAFSRPTFPTQIWLIDRFYPANQDYFPTFFVPEVSVP